jgi:hypothetical protein
VCLAARITGLKIQEVSRRSGLSEPTLRYYEEVAAKRAFPRKRLVKLCTKRFRGDVDLV